MESFQLRFNWAMKNWAKMSKLFHPTTFSGSNSRNMDNIYQPGCEDERIPWSSSEPSGKGDLTTIEPLNKNIKRGCHTMKSSKETKTSQFNWYQNEGEWERVHGFLASDLASRLSTSNLASLWRAGHGRGRQRETFGSFQSIRLLLCIVIEYDFTKLYIGPWVEVDNPGGDDHPLQWA